MWPAEKRHFTQEQFGRYIKDIVWRTWRPSLIIWHNTAAPSLKQWIKTAEEDATKGLVPGWTRINNLERYFRVNNGWSGCPHLFVANDFIWVMNPLIAPGVHSPSWNSISIGIEMIGDFSTENDEAGAGLLVKQNTIYATAMICETLGLDPLKCIKLHKEDPRTTHDCPGKNIAQDKHSMQVAVQDMMGAGEHDPVDVGRVIAGEIPVDPIVTYGEVTIDSLNLRRGPGVSNPINGVLNKGLKVEIVGEAMNGTTSWLQVRTPGGYFGWASGRYIRSIA